jgi:ketosteroid isomerase-like protein
VSQENVDRTMDFMKAYNRRDFDAAVEFFHPEVDWVLPALQRSDSCRGPDEIRRFWEGLEEGSGLEIDTELYH